MILSHQDENKKSEDSTPMTAFRLVHNLAMTLLNAYLVVEFLRQAYYTSFFGQIVRDERGTGVLKRFWHTEIPTYVIFFFL